MRGALRALHRFWFAPETPVTPPLMRIVLGAYVLFGMLPRDLRAVRRAWTYPTELVVLPPTLELLPIPFPLPPELGPTFAAVMTALGVMVTIGLLTRPALIAYAIGYIYIGAVASSWGHYPHHKVLPVQMFMILAFAPGATAWSVDRLLMLRLRQRKGVPLSLPSALTGPPVARWGTQLILVVIASIMFAAGLAKLRHTGVRWADGETLRFYFRGGTAILPSTARTDSLPPQSRRPYFVGTIVGPANVPPEVAWRDGFGLEAYTYMVSIDALGRVVRKWPWTATAISVMTLVVELTMPLLLLTPWLRSLYLTAAIGLMVGINFILGISFAPWIVVFLCALNWEWIVDHVPVALRQLKSGRLWPPGRLLQREEAPG